MNPPQKKSDGLDESRFLFSKVVNLRTPITVKFQLTSPGLTSATMDHNVRWPLHINVYINNRVLMNGFHLSVFVDAATQNVIIFGDSMQKVTFRWKIVEVVLSTYLQAWYNQMNGFVV